MLFWDTTLKYRHCRYIGQINQTDFFTRLLAGISYTGLAPASFYKDPAGPDRHFDGMWASRFIDTASLRCMHSMQSQVALALRCVAALHGCSQAIARMRSCMTCGAGGFERPVEFVAGGIAGVLSHHRSGIGAYHVVNPHWGDGVSLDAIIGWVAEARVGVRRVQDYRQWCAMGVPTLPGMRACARPHGVALCASFTTSLVCCTWICCMRAYKI